MTTKQKNKKTETTTKEKVIEAINNEMGYSVESSIAGDVILSINEGRIRIGEIGNNGKVNFYFHGSPMNPKKGITRLAHILPLAEMLDKNGFNYACHYRKKRDYEIIRNTSEGLIRLLGKMECEGRL